MPLGDYGWQRFSSGQVPFTSWPGSIFQLVATTHSDLTTPAPWVLVRTEAEIKFNIGFGSTSGGDKTRLIGAEAWFGVKFQAGLDAIDMQRNDEDKGTLGIQVMTPNPVGDPGGVSAFNCVWKQPQPFVNLTKRAVGAANYGTVSAFLWLNVGELGDGGGYYDVRLSTLWARQV